MHHFRTFWLYLSFIPSTNAATSSAKDLINSIILTFCRCPADLLVHNIDNIISNGPGEQVLGKMFNALAHHICIRG
jgi:hypothetical protein